MSGQVMPPALVIRVGGVAGSFNINHGLNGVPSAAVPLAQTPGILRLDQPLYDALKVYLHASDNSVYGILAIWPVSTIPSTGLGSKPLGEGNLGE